MASRYWVGGGANTNWSNTQNWSATSGGAGSAGVPTSTDDVFFDGVGATANGTSTIGAVITVLSLTITGFTGTMAHNAVLSVAGNVTLATGYTITGSSGLTITAGAVLTSNGKTWPNLLTLASTSLKTLADNWTIGSLNNSNSSSLNGSTLYINGGVVINFNLGGTTAVVLQGATGWSGTASLSNAGGLTIAGNVSGTINYQTGILLYSSGTVTAALNLTSNATVNTGGMTWGSATFAGGTVTLNSLFLANNLTLGTSAVIVSGGFGFTVNNLAFSQTTAQTVTLKDDNIYTVNNAMTCNVNIRGATTITSSHATNRVVLTLGPTASCTVNASFTRVNAGGGKTISTWNGTVTNCINVNSYTDYEPVGLTF